MSARGQLQTSRPWFKIKSGRENRVFREEANDDITSVWSTIVAGLIAGIASARAQDASAAYIVSYIEVAPPRRRLRQSLCCVRYAMRAARRRETAALKFPAHRAAQQFAILEVWSDAKGTGGTSCGSEYGAVA